MCLPEKAKETRTESSSSRKTEEQEAPIPTTASLREQDGHGKAELPPPASSTTESNTVFQPALELVGRHWDRNGDPLEMIREPFLDNTPQKLITLFEMGQKSDMSDSRRSLRHVGDPNSSSSSRVWRDAEERTDFRKGDNRPQDRDIGVSSEGGWGKKTTEEHNSGAHTDVADGLGQRSRFGHGEGQRTRPGRDPLASPDQNLPGFRNTTTNPELVSHPDYCSGSAEGSVGTHTTAETTLGGISTRSLKEQRVGAWNPFASRVEQSVPRESDWRRGRRSDDSSVFGPAGIPYERRGGPNSPLKGRIAAWSGKDDSWEEGRRYPPHRRSKSWEDRVENAARDVGDNLPSYEVERTSGERGAEARRQAIRSGIVPNDRAFVPQRGRQVAPQVPSRNIPPSIAAPPATAPPAFAHAWQQGNPNTYHRDLNPNPPTKQPDRFSQGGSNEGSPLSSPSLSPPMHPSQPNFGELATLRGSPGPQLPNTFAAKAGSTQRGSLATCDADHYSALGSHARRNHHTAASVHHTHAYQLQPRNQNNPGQHKQGRHNHTSSLQSSGFQSQSPAGHGVAPQAGHRNPHHHHHQGHHISSPVGPSSRSSPEVLKTLLRKKACLYEAGTSHAIALVTWLVGRRLALKHGYFSRQDLQSGVHAVVADKIEAGVITRTKVNRCMQIILNSCFHYIIPRPDGSEEDGTMFRNQFESQAEDDADLLNQLPKPWTDLVVDVDVADVLFGSVASDEDEDEMTTATSSTATTRRKRSRLGSPPDSPGPGDQNDVGTKEQSGIASKRAVLLCFNENVRSAGDVFRCHNEFIRDAAISANLVLRADEWRSFFSGEHPTPTAHELASLATPTPPAQTSRPRSGSDPTATHKHKESDSDVLGNIAAPDLAKFRTTWCAKRYEHNHTLCGFAHIDINAGWLRRDPSVYRYSDVMCRHVKPAQDGAVDLKGALINSCPLGVECPHAHSWEEIEYHPRRYKRTACPSQPSSCVFQDICPHFHTEDGPKITNTRFKSSPSAHSSHHHHHPRHAPREGGSGGRSSVGALQSSRQFGNNTASTSSVDITTLPAGSPMLYVRPAPKSEFEEYLGLPGLQALFRRHCATLHAQSQGRSQSSCHYGIFGDDWGLTDAEPPREATVS